jgi:hypothetical protein
MLMETADWNRPAKRISNAFFAHNATGHDSESQ